MGSYIGSRNGNSCACLIEALEPWLPLSCMKHRMQGRQGRAGYIQVLKCEEDTQTCI